MQRTGSSRLLVTEGDRLLGIVSLKDLLRFLDLKLELEGTAASSSILTTRYRNRRAKNLPTGVGHVFDLIWGRKRCLPAQ